MAQKQLLPCSTGVAPSRLLMRALLFCFVFFSYDTQGRGYITYQEFLQKLGITYSPEIHRPYTEDYFNFLGHFTKPQQIQEEIQELHQIPDKTMPARLVCGSWGSEGRGAGLGLNTVLHLPWQPKLH
jgi:hypothetical protein